jgi:hypothetical protein
MIELHDRDFRRVRVARRCAAEKEHETILRGGCPHLVDVFPKFVVRFGVRSRECLRRKPAAPRFDVGSGCGSEIKNQRRAIRMPLQQPTSRHYARQVCERLIELLDDIEWPIWIEWILARLGEFQDREHIQCIPRVNEILQVAYCGFRGGHDDSLETVAVGGRRNDLSFQACFKDAGHLSSDACGGWRTGALAKDHD